LHLPTLPYSPHVNGKQENLWGRVEVECWPCSKAK
jgi:hypothetical protein